MCRFEHWALLVLLVATGVEAAPTQPWHGLGRALAPEEIASWDIDVRPDGLGLPKGKGSVADGQAVYDARCASCHGTFGESTDYLALAGGIGSLATPTPQRTVGSKLDHATTLWDYINRAMPFDSPKSLSVDEVYAVTAYVLNLNDIVPADAVLDQDSLPAVKMPNRDGFTTAHGLGAVDGKPDIHAIACMKDCGPTPVITSQLPEGFAAQMYGDLRTHFRNFAAVPVAAAATRTPGLDLAQANGCLACHDPVKAKLGPAFADVASRYAKSPQAREVLVQKIRQGGSGSWGSLAMPPQARIAASDLDTVLDWILAGARTP